MREINNAISYIEISVHNISKAKEFYNKVFDWEFTDYGDEYTSFKSGTINGGFTKSDKSIPEGILIVLYHENLNEVKEKISRYEGKISKEIFEFPGGKRFHFIDTNGVEMAVWSDN